MVWYRELGERMFGNSAELGHELDEVGDLEAEVFSSQDEQLVLRESVKEGIRFERSGFFERKRETER
jgi:hypothetical protein